MSYTALVVPAFAPVVHGAGAAGTPGADHPLVRLYHDLQFHPFSG